MVYRVSALGAVTSLKSAVGILAQTDELTHRRLRALWLAHIGDDPAGVFHRDEWITIDIGFGAKLRRFGRSERSGERELCRAASENAYSDGTGQRSSNECAFGCSHSSFHYAALRTWSSIRFWGNNRPGDRGVFQSGYAMRYSAGPKASLRALSRSQAFHRLLNSYRLVSFFPPAAVADILGEGDEVIVELAA